MFRHPSLKYKFKTLQDNHLDRIEKQGLPQLKFSFSPQNVSLAYGNLYFEKEIVLKISKIMLSPGEVFEKRRTIGSTENRIMPSLQ